MTGYFRTGSNKQIHDESMGVFHMPEPWMDTSDTRLLVCLVCPSGNRLRICKNVFSLEGVLVTFSRIHNLCAFWPCAHTCRYVTMWE